MSPTSTDQLHARSPECQCPTSCWLKYIIFKKNSVVLFNENYSQFSVESSSMKINKIFSSYLTFLFHLFLVFMIFLQIFHHIIKMTKNWTFSFIKCFSKWCSILSSNQSARIDDRNHVDYLAKDLPIFGLVLLLKALFMPRFQPAKSLFDILCMCFDIEKFKNNM